MGTLKQEDKNMLTNHLPIAELREDGCFYLDGTRVRGVQSYKLEGARTPIANRVCSLTLKILIDSKLLIKSSK